MIEIRSLNRPGDPTVLGETPGITEPVHKRIGASGEPVHK